MTYCEPGALTLRSTTTCFNSSRKGRDLRSFQRRRSQKKQQQSVSERRQASQCSMRQVKLNLWNPGDRGQQSESTCTGCSPRPPRPLQRQTGLHLVRFRGERASNEARGGELGSKASWG